MSVYVYISSINGWCKIGCGCGFVYKQRTDIENSITELKL